MAASTPCEQNSKWPFLGVLGEACELHAKEPTLEYIWGPKPRLMVICVRKVGLDVCWVKGVWRWLMVHPAGL